jgi:hypothetical protein
MATYTETSLCWRLVNPGGKDHDSGDGVRHFDNERHALLEIQGVDLSPRPTPQQFAAPCVRVTCDECEQDLETDAFTMHLESIEDAHDVARKSDWKVTKDGRTYCWDCPVQEKKATIEDHLA